MAKQKEEKSASRIARVLTERIISGSIAPGARLRQDHIAKEFGASHVPVREAFLLLEARRLVASEPNRGVRVTSFDIEELREVAEMRSALEALALRHAAPNLTPAILDTAEEMTRVVESSRDVREWEQANRDFHRLILEPCRMPRLLSTINELQLASARFLFAAWRSEWEARTDHDHRAILAALRNGETDLACVTLARHVGWLGKHPSRIKNNENRAAYAIFV